MSANREAFGGCPECGTSDHILNVGKSHWGICPWHELRWYIGENLFSSWREESEETWALNRELLEGYREVESVHEAPVSRVIYTPEGWQ